MLNAQFPFAGSLREAMAMIADLPIRMPDIHTFPLGRVVCRILAQDYRAPFSVPGFRRSRLDGYAVRSADLSDAASASPVRLSITGSVPAGTWPVPDITPGTCCRIMAGAALPDAADAVLGFAKASPADNGTVTFSSPVSPGAAVDEPEIDAKKGEVLLKRGTRLMPAHIGRLAGTGVTNLPVFSRPRVAVLSTGSELLLAGMPPSPGKIYNSNQAVICGMLMRQNVIPLPCGIAMDDIDAIAGTITLAVQDSTMLITTGGVGRGDCDCILRAMEKAGCKILLAGADFRPGGNMALARLNGKYILSLSGAPGSSLVTLALLGVPLLRRLSGDNNWMVPEVDVLLNRVPNKAPHGVLVGRLLLNGGHALFDPVSTPALERSSMDLVLPLEGNEDLEAIVRERTTLRALWLGDQDAFHAAN